ncbi:unnamed protein product [Onchocerca flexuosa]|uniref:Uncharacterized protein n=1 Tax=Onchocerca flexuosa TaxID=387005 RepID=A0A183HZA2_9BILA|nr:unnamed protein product [Onchocerca flexuosa]
MIGESVKWRNDNSLRILISNLDIWVSKWGIYCWGNQNNSSTLCITQVERNKGCRFRWRDDDDDGDDAGGEGEQIDGYRNV